MRPACILPDAASELREALAAPTTATQAGALTVHRDVALISITGVLIPSVYARIAAQTMRAATDGKIVGVVYEIDSPGGSVSGLFETATLVGRLSKLKPTMAVVTDMAASAAYAIASQAGAISVPKHGMVGSIGVIQLHVEASRANERAGVAVSVLRAGQRKADMNFYEALSPAARGDALAELEAIRLSFADLVARGRGARFSADQAMATEARVYPGHAAAKMGLADIVLDPLEATAAFIAEMGAV